MGDSSSSEKMKSEAVKIIESFQLLPKLVVFDLDYTLWPFYCECRSKRESPSLYPHAMGILLALKHKGIDIAIASRSPTADIAKAFLNKLGITPFFVAQVCVHQFIFFRDYAVIVDLFFDLIFVVVV
jgi:magnesium-dependent phosphatase 1